MSEINGGIKWKMQLLTFLLKLVFFINSKNPPQSQYPLGHPLPHRELFNFPDLK